MKKILCPGEALIDMVATDNTGNLEITSEFKKKAGGAPINAAGAMAKFGIEPYFIGSVGNDPFGRYLTKEMHKYAINTEYLAKLSLPTTLAFVSLTETGERDFYFVRGADAKITIPDVADLKQFSCFHFASATAFLGDELEEGYDKLLNFAQENKILTSFDANYREALYGDKQDLFISKALKYVDNCDIVKLSDDEARLIAQEKEVIHAGVKLIKLNCKYLIITCGAKGSYLFTKEGFDFIASNPVKMIDATGAGDAFIGSLLGQIVRNNQELTKDKLIDFIKISSKIGAMTTQKRGALESIPAISEI